MQPIPYLIIGTSHAGLEAASTLRQIDDDSRIVMVGREPGLPYSPTILPYIVSGQSRPDRVALRNANWFREQRIELIAGDPLTELQVGSCRVTLASGQQLQYQKLLLATGADPIVPPITGLSDCRYHTLRTRQQAIELREQATRAQTALVLGGGLIGMHAAENLRKAGLEVTLVERQPQVLPGYFDPEAAEMVAGIFRDNGVDLRLGCQVTAIEPMDEGCRAILENGDCITADLLLLAAGVQPRMEYLQGDQPARQQGILVDRHMRSSVEGIWAAGDVAQAADFYSDQPVMTSILPDAVVQGRIAAQDMSGDTQLVEYPGGIPLNTYHFFGRQAIVVGRNQLSDQDAEYRQTDQANGQYRRMLLRDNRLQGYTCIDEPVDPGILWQLIQRRVDLGPCIHDFTRQPLETARLLMSRNWS